jgi:hypothetical protein
VSDTREGRTGRFLPGRSGNPGGRPGSAAFRERCRWVADIALDKILELIALADSPKHLPAVTEAYAVVADRGGYVAADKDAAVLLQALKMRQEIGEEAVGGLLEGFRRNYPPEPAGLPPGEEPST